MLYSNVVFMRNTHMKDLSGVIIAAIVLTLMITAILIPITNGVSTTTVTDTNEDVIGSAGKFSKVDELVLAYEGDADTGYPTINGRPISDYVETASNYNVISTNFIAVAYATDNTTWNYFINNEGTYIPLIGGASSRAMIVTIADNKATFTSGGEVQYELVSDYCFVCDKNGTYANISPTLGEVIIGKSSDIVVYNNQSSNNGNGYGTYDNIITGYHATSQVIDTDDTTYTIGYEEVSLGDSEFLKVTSANGSIIGPVEYSYTEHKEGVEYTLLGYVPIIILAGVITAILGTALYRRA